MSVGMDFNQLSTSHYSVISILAYYIFSFPAVAVCIWLLKKYTNWLFSMKASAKLTLSLDIAWLTLCGHYCIDSELDGLDVTLHKWLPLFSGRHHSLHCGRFGEIISLSLPSDCLLFGKGKRKWTVTFRRDLHLQTNNLVFDVAVHGDATNNNPL